MRHWENHEFLKGVLSGRKTEEGSMFDVYSISWKAEVITFNVVLKSV